MGEAQVRTPAAVEAVPVFVAAAYAFLLLAGTEDRQGGAGFSRNGDGKNQEIEHPRRASSEACEPSHGEKEWA